MWPNLKESVRCPFLSVAAGPPCKGNACELWCLKAELHPLCLKTPFSSPPFPLEVLIALWRNSFSCKRRMKRKSRARTWTRSSPGLTFSLQKKNQTCVCVCLSPRQKLLSWCSNFCKQRDRQLLFCQLNCYFLLNMCSMSRTVLTSESEGRALTFISFRRD